MIRNSDKDCIAGAGNPLKFCFIGKLAELARRPILGTGFAYLSESRQGELASLPKR